LLENTIDRRIVINLDLNAASAVIVGEPSQLQNAFLNLGINGSQSMTEGGILTFSTQQLDVDDLFCEISSFNIEPGKYLEVEVRDTGCGITPEDQDKIFDPFFTTKAQGVGTGLGLAAVYGVVQQHQGAIHVYSTPDTGTSFQMLFPLSTEEVSLDLNLPPVMKGSGRILVVNDEEVMRITAQAILEDLGYEVILANDGEQAVKIYEKNQENIDLVILDMVMPIMNGRDCYLRLKQQDVNVRVLLASGFSREDDIQEMKINGLKGFIRKPYSRSSFSQIVHKVLS
jgi:CheY-like chemotaxis protein